MNFAALEQVFLLHSSNNHQCLLGVSNRICFSGVRTLQGFMCTSTFSDAITLDV